MIEVMYSFVQLVILTITKFLNAPQLTDKRNTLHHETTQ
jgi:hypothetical protein